MITPAVWLGLMIGNSRLHWAYYQKTKLKYTWNTQHSSQVCIESLLPSNIEIESSIPIYFASVVPAQTKIWQGYPWVTMITLEDIPLDNLYSTIGIDRALAVLGAGETYGYPCLVIDAGTALTLTGVGDQRNLVGGAILGGLSLQFKTLYQNTASLPKVILPKSLPQQWGLDTPTAIESGIIYTLLSGIEAFIKNWCQQFPKSSLIITGGDGQLILTYLKQYNIDLYRQLKYDESLIFEGMKYCINQSTSKVLY